MSIDLVIPENPEPIIPSLGFAYAIENASGEIMAATTVLMRADPKSGGLKARGVNHADAARAMSESIVKFAESCDEAVRVRYMTPDEYATWCDDNDNEDEAPADDDEDGDEFADEDDDA